MRLLDLGKYKGIIVSIALFLLLDASVLMMNFYISFEISEDAVGVNIAGRQRMLSQRTMKSLLDTQVSIAQPERPIAELRNTSALFDNTLQAFANGGETPGADGKPAQLNKISSSTSIGAVAAGQNLWKPYKAHIDTLLDAYDSGDNTAFEAALSAAINYGQSNNLMLLKLMNDLTVDLENVASSKATRLRIIQTVGISLAIINFFIIMFHFLRQLRESDERIDAARKETQEILQTVNEGLFLIDYELVIGKQYSAELETIFNRRNFAGTHFSELLKDVISEKDMETTHKFIELLFQRNVKQQLIGDLNPLSQIEIHLPLKDGGYESKYLSFSFSRAIHNKTINHVLVTVTDITRQIRLSHELASAKAQNEQQLELLSSLLNADQKMLPIFIGNSLRTFEKINHSLSLSARTREQFIDKANTIYAHIHGFKGDAAALELDHFVESAHEFEDVLEQIKTKTHISGTDFLKLTVLLNQIIFRIESTQALTVKLQHFSGFSKTTNETASASLDWHHLQQLATKIATKQNKMVEVIHSGLSDPMLSDRTQTVLNTIAIQLTRNAVSHGIETISERLNAQKPERGQINIRLARRGTDTIQFSFSDDGQGLNLKQIRQSAIANGLISAPETELMSAKETISLIFSPSLSTNTRVDEDAGRGIGMHSVKSLVQELGGKISISSRKNIGCTFTIVFPSQRLEIAKAA